MRKVTSGRRIPQLAAKGGASTPHQPTPRDLPTPSQQPPTPLLITTVTKY